VVPVGFTLLPLLGDLAALVSVALLAVVTAAKGRGWLLLLGLFLTPLVWIFAALRLAAPSSVWARRRYGTEKLSRARWRYGSDTAGRRSRLLVWITAAIFAAFALSIGVRAFATGTSIVGALVVIAAVLLMLAPIIITVWLMNVQDERVTGEPGGASGFAREPHCWSFVRSGSLVTECSSPVCRGVTPSSRVLPLFVPSGSGLSAHRLTMDTWRDRSTSPTREMTIFTAPLSRSTRRAD
jgi:hypothetical protein